jgi:hypothetical protein
MTPDARRFVFPLQRHVSDIYVLENFDPKQSRRAPGEAALAVVPWTNDIPFGRDLLSCQRGEVKQGQ